MTCDVSTCASIAASERHSSTKVKSVGSLAFLRHHSTVMAEQQKNLGAILIAWDVIFGTRLLPGRDPPEEVGAGASPDYPETFAGQLAAPFVSRLWAA